MEEKDNVFIKLAKKFTKNRLVAFNVMICMIVAICFVIGMCTIFAHEPPKDLKEVTGTIAEFNQYDDNWTDAYFGISSYFDIRFEDGRFFKATGISYDNINRELFKKIQVGEEIKITYSSSFSTPNRIYAIEYNGVDYLLLDDVLKSYANEAKTSHITGAIIIGVSVVAGGVALFVVNWKHRKKNIQNV